MTQSTSQPTYGVPNNAEHERISALFLGPKAENADLLTNCFNLIVQRQAQGRKAYFPEDQVIILNCQECISKFTLLTPPGLHH